MRVEKLSISLPKELAAQIDELAEKSGVSRSTIIREAAAHYVTARQEEAEAERRHNSIEEALAGFDEVASVWGADDRQGIEYLAELRDAKPLEEEIGGCGCE